MKQKEDFGKYIEGHKQLIRKIAAMYCYEMEERKDLMQEIILQLWKSFPKFDDSYKFSTWMYRIALNVCISYVRKTISRSKAIENYKTHIQIEIQDSGQEDEKLLVLYNAIKILKPIDRAIVTLNLEGCSHAEIAEILGTSPSNISSRFLRIKNKLRNHINK